MLIMGIMGISYQAQWPMVVNHPWIAGSFPLLMCPKDQLISWLSWNYLSNITILTRTSFPDFAHQVYQSKSTIQHGRFPFLKLNSYDDAVDEQNPAPKWSKMLVGLLYTPDFWVPNYYRDYNNPWYRSQLTNQMEYHEGFVAAAQMNVY